MLARPGGQQNQTRCNREAAGMHSFPTYAKSYRERYLNLGEAVDADEALTLGRHYERTVILVLGKPDLSKQQTRHARISLCLLSMKHRLPRPLRRP